METEITEYQIPGHEQMEHTFINRQEFNKMLIGMTFGLNFNIFRNLDFSLKYLQTFTPPGKDYNWQRQRIIQTGLTFNFGKTFSPRKLEFGRSSTRTAGADYRTLGSSNVVRVIYRYMGEGNNIVFRFRTADKQNYILREMIIGNSSGELRITEFESMVRDVGFPFFANMRFNFENPSTQSTINYHLNFEILRSGNWDVIVEY